MANHISKHTTKTTNGKDLAHLVNRFMSADWLDEEHGNLLLSTWTPRINIKNEPTQLVIHADVPGVELKDIDITVRDGMLIIEGKKETKSEKKTESYIRIERFTGSFSRAIPLTEMIDSKTIKAKVKNGVLEIIAKKVKTQKIKVTK